MQPSRWQPPVELSAQEEQIVAWIRRAKLFVFLRHYRHELFDEAFQQELASLYRPSKRGHLPIVPAQLERRSRNYAALKAMRADNTALAT